MVIKNKRHIANCNRFAHCIVGQTHIVINQRAKQTKGAEKWEYLTL